MNDSDRTEQRLMALEIKASFAEDLVDELNRVIVRQQQQIDMLTRTLAALQQQVQNTDVGAPAVRNPVDELPPHY